MALPTKAISNCRAVISLLPSVPLKLMSLSATEAIILVSPLLDSMAKVSVYPDELYPTLKLLSTLPVVRY